MSTPKNEFVLIQSNDGYSFVIKREVAMASGMLKNMLDEDSAFEEAKSNRVVLQQRGIVVAKVIEYLSYKVQYADFATGDITEDFTERIPPEIALELLMAADFLDA